MNQVYTIELSKNGIEIIMISDEYWNQYGAEFLKNKESFDNQIVEFLKNVHDIHSRDNIIIKTPPMRVADRHIFHTFTRRNIVDFKSMIGHSYTNCLPMLIYILKKPDIPKEQKRIMDENTKLYLENLKKIMFQQFETMWNTTMKQHFDI